MLSHGKEGCGRDYYEDVHICRYGTTIHITFQIHIFYYKISAEVVLHKIQLNRSCFLTQFYYFRYPQPGFSFTLKIFIFFCMYFMHTIFSAWKDLLNRRSKINGLPPSMLNLLGFFSLKYDIGVHTYHFTLPLIVFMCILYNHQVSIRCIY